MVYKKRSNYENCENCYIHSEKRTRKTKKIKSPSNSDLFPCKFRENNYSTEIPNTKLSTSSLYDGCESKKRTKLQTKPLNRSHRSLCYSSYSINDVCGRCETPLLRGRKPAYDSSNIDLLNIPESDRRILEILALKKEQEIESEKIAYQSQLLWEKSQNERIKRNELRERQVHESLKKAIIDVNFRQKEDEVEEFFQRHIEELEEKLNRAESQRRSRQEQIHRRVASANRSEDVRHQENMLDLLAEQSLTQHQKQRQCRERESRARERHIEIRQRRERSLKQMRAEQEERAAIVREMHRELERGLEAWQDQVMLLQWADHQRAEAVVQSQKEDRKMKVEVENKERQILHQQRLKKVREAEQKRQQSVRQEITAKEEKIRSLQRQRERELLEGRAQAQMTADLREHLRQTLSPETFDRKVARAALETRMSNRPISVSPSLLSSHIHLG
ncbi:trichohyalin-like [Macrosteles quadrilineatus]|uniref:trichohyalin-like n=1 Tax=Macrosteles quadrilineatus TaxID=74068 RepID=UPI0023E19E98|nr:trichohyalin-like [Macrosteles quadrilineatus]